MNKSKIAVLTVLFIASLLSVAARPTPQGEGECRQNCTQKYKDCLDQNGGDTESCKDDYEECDKGCAENSERCTKECSDNARECNDSCARDHEFDPQGLQECTDNCATERENCEKDCTKDSSRLGARLNNDPLKLTESDACRE
jgi:hypothetical protein